MSLASGIISLAISALNVTLSVSASPIVILPSAVIVPVAYTFPYTLVSENISTDPVPLGTNSMFSFDVFVLITLFSKSKLSTVSLF